MRVLKHVQFSLDPYIRPPYAKTIRIGFGADPRMYKTIIATVSKIL